ncbi:hypothetical protein [Thermoleptolyngbya sp.]
MNKIIGALGRLIYSSALQPHVQAMAHARGYATGTQADLEYA